MSIRVVAATALEPATAVKEGTLRRDLVEKLSVASIVIPPLRDRAEDIPVLARHILQTLEVANPGDLLTPNIVAFLQSQPWSENVQELRDALRHAVAMAEGGRLEIEHFPSQLADRVEISKRLQYLVWEWVQRHARKAVTEPSDLCRKLHEVVEAALVAEVLKQRRDHILPTARWLGLSRATVRKLVRKYQNVSVDSEG